MTNNLPNVILVVFDTARRDRFGCYGYDRPTTPTVDGLVASGGMQVQSMTANAPWTMPSHASLFTGLYPSQHGSQWKTGPRMRESVPLTMAEWFASLGYETVCATNNGLISDKTRLARGFDRYAFRLDLERGRRRIRRRLKKVLMGGDSGGRVINDWMRTELSSVKRPMFLFVNYLECHWAYVPPRKFEKRVGGKRFGLIEGMRYRAGLARTAGPWEAIAKADERTLEIYSNLYDAELANADNHLADLMGILKASGHFADGETLLMVTSDHGEHIGERGLADHHAALDDLLIHVPFVAWGPGLVPAGKRAGTYEFVDVLPSLMRLLGKEPPQHLAGRRTDLFEESEAGSNGHHAFSEWRAWSDKEQARLADRNPSFNFTGLDNDLLSVRGDRYKLVRRSDGTFTLYDLSEDPAETTDVAHLHPEIAAALRRDLEEQLATWEGWDTESSALTDEEAQEIEKRLAALGYI